MAHAICLERDLHVLELIPISFSAPVRFDGMYPSRPRCCGKKVIALRLGSVFLSGEICVGEVCRWIASCDGSAKGNSSDALVASSRCIICGAGGERVLRCFKAVISIVVMRFHRSVRIESMPV